MDQTAFGNTDLLEELYENYCIDPKRVDPSWRRAFADLEGQPPTLKASPKFRSNQRHKQESIADLMT